MIHDRSSVPGRGPASARFYRGMHEPLRYTLHTFRFQCKKRMASYWSGVQTPAMPTVSAASRQLKQLRQRAGLSIRDVAQQLGMEHGSSYQHYEDRFKKPLLPLELVMKLVPIFEAGGVEPSELYALAGVNATGERLLVAAPPTRAPADARTIRIEELDVRASAGAGLTGENEKVVAEWQVPSGVVRGYSTAPATEMRIITVMGDSMEPALLPGQRVLVDTGDRKPSPPGIFVVWDGLGLVIKRVQMVPHSEPPRVKITSDNIKYESYERTLEEAYIQGRVIGQWRWL
jgi:phage repressor protein C with HTH and peptisase S24 domain